MRFRRFSDSGYSDMGSEFGVGFKAENFTKDINNIRGDVGLATGYEALRIVKAMLLGCCDVSQAADWHFHIRDDYAQDSS